jgi:hypothetical protein
MLSNVSDNLKRLYNLFEISPCVLDMEKFITTKNPQTITDVERLEREYDSRMKSNFSFFS